MVFFWQALTQYPPSQSIKWAGSAMSFSQRYLITIQPIFHCIHHHHNPICPKREDALLNPPITITAVNTIDPTSIIKQRNNHRLVTPHQSQAVTTTGANANILSGHQANQ